MALPKQFLPGAMSMDEGESLITGPLLASRLRLSLGRARKPGPAVDGEWAAFSRLTSSLLPRTAL